MIYLKISNNSIPFEVPKCPLVNLHALIKSHIQGLASVPTSESILLHSGRILTAEELADIVTGSRSAVFLDVSVRLRGGKGGFGSLLKSQKQKFRTSNFDAMRDLSGRRVRHVNQERQLREFSAPSEERVAEIRKEFYAISKTGSDIEKRKCYFGAECKYKYKCRYLHPGEGDARLRKVFKRDPKWNPNFDFRKGAKQDDFPDLDLGRQMERSAKSMELAAKRALKIVGSHAACKGAQKSVKKAKKCKPEEGKPCETPEKERVEKPMIGEVKIEEKSTEKVGPGGSLPPEPVKEKINLEKFEDAKALEGVGAFRLKDELKRLGLKCGGTVSDRAARLFELKTKVVEQLPRSFFPKERKRNS